jgi:hypothetical protein
VDTALKAYLKQIRAVRSSGQATEASYYGALGTLIEALGGKGVTYVNQPKAQRYGVPDFIVERNGVPIGHIECKDIGDKLDDTAESDQLQRYREALPNLILTDFLEFRWYVDGKLRETARLARSESSGTIKSQIGGSAAVESLFSNFMSAQAATVGTAADLAIRMASKARLLRDAIFKIVSESPESEEGLPGLLKSYRAVLIADMTDAEFADLQAQSAAYVLFAARCLHEGTPDSFDRKAAIWMKTTPFLSDVFFRIAGPFGEPAVTWILDDLALLLSRADLAAILEDFGRESKGDDPIVHFYEGFLKAYAPDLRELRGAYYTPDAVVSYIIRSVDALLRDDFDITNGLADVSEVEVETEDGDSIKSPRVLILDPATGTGTFLREVIRRIHADLKERGLEGAWPNYVAEHLLGRIFGFEVMMAPYVIAHLQLALEIGASEDRFSLPVGERLNVYLTNSLEPAPEQVGPSMFSEIAREGREAGFVKGERPVMVVIGNPPYRKQSANKGDWITKLLRGKVDGSAESYFSVEGQSINEKNPRWVSDDYVKFIRFAQWRIERTGEGILGFITNHNYLDAPTFRGMRESLISAFDEIYILDLHGNTRSRESAPNGAADENVFDIQQGVVITFFVKRSSEDLQNARVMHADLWGSREAKYEWLTSHSVRDTDWDTLAPTAPDFRFIPRDSSYQAEYERGWSLDEIFLVGSAGVVTGRDSLAIQMSVEEMSEVASDLADLTEEEMRTKYVLEPDSESWTLSRAQEDVKAHPEAENHVRRLQHRPFDTRFTYYTGVTDGVMCRPRTDVMSHMLLGENVALISSRTQPAHGQWTYCGVTRDLARVRCFANGARGVSNSYPLYLYRSEEADNEREMPLGVPDRTANLANSFVDILKETVLLEFDSSGQLGGAGTFNAEDVLHYVYAILNSPEYRLRYADCLLSGFPRIPLPTSREMFAALALLGEELTRLHLMEAQVTSGPAFKVGGENRIERVRYSKPTEDRPGRVFVNKSQHFEGVSEEVWEFTIGGYKPAEKWLSDRKGRSLSYDDIDWYRHICAALGETLQVMSKIDEAIEGHGGWPISYEQLEATAPDSPGDRRGIESSDSPGV